MSDAGWTGSGVIRLERQVINGQSTPSFIVTFADGAVGTITGVVARGLIGEVAAGFAIGAAIVISPAALIGIGVAGALIGLATTWALANSHQKIPLTAEP
jgi:hypothetical protein